MQMPRVSCWCSDVVHLLERPAELCANLPHLHALAFTELGFLGFLGVYAYCYVRLWACARDVGAGKLKAN